MRAKPSDRPLNTSWMLLLDLDGTLWDHLDISSLSPPFRRVSEDVIEDSRGVRVRIYGYMVDLARWARSIGAMVVSLSWNDPEIAMEALRAFKVDVIFDYHIIEPHPWKGRALARFLKETGILIPPERMIYFDDREIHLDDIYTNVGRVKYVKSHVDCRGFESCRRLVASLLGLQLHRS
ncbi:MAG: magnesium-dependent phosphatase-1 [Desulfurococcales archaeon]|nr:magnesium-dependent phosphatase-1 [Desulfurococcales archaeon]